jgi:hypothetical protein
MLDLSKNFHLFSETNGVQALKEGLISNRTLRTLILESVGMKPETAIALAEALPESTGLYRLNILDNDAALNPLRANTLNIGQNVAAYGQKALKAVTLGWNSAVSSLQSAQVRLPPSSSRGNLASIKDGEEQQATEAGKQALSEAMVTEPKSTNQMTMTSTQPSPPSLPASLAVAIPTAAENALGAMMAFVVSMRLNRNITSIEMLSPADINKARTMAEQQYTRVPMDNQKVSIEAEVSSMVSEILSLCERNARSLAANSNGDASNKEEQRTETPATTSFSRLMPSRSMSSLIQPTEVDATVGKVKRETEVMAQKCKLLDQLLTSRRSAVAATTSEVLFEGESINDGPSADELEVITVNA